MRSVDSVVEAQTDAAVTASVAPDPATRGAADAAASRLHDESRWVPALIIGLVALYIGVVLVLPMASLVVEAVKLGLPAIAESLTHRDTVRALGMSLLLMVLCIVINAVVGTIGAIAIARHKFIGRSALSALADLPLAVSPVMIGLGFLILVGRNGWLSPLFDPLGIKLAFAFGGLVLASLFVTLPFTVREVVYVLEEIGTSEEEAAATLGAPPWQIFWRVTLPNIRNALGYGLLMTAARSLGEFGAVLVLGGSITGHTQTATTFIHDAIEERELAGAYGMAIVLALISVGLLLALEITKSKRHEARQ